jgi:hypothetical protein
MPATILAIMLMHKKTGILKQSKKRFKMQK